MTEPLDAEWYHAELKAARASIQRVTEERDDALASREFWRTSKCDEISLDLADAAASIQRVRDLQLRPIDGVRQDYATSHDAGYNTAIIAVRRALDSVAGESPVPPEVFGVPRSAEADAEFDAQMDAIREAERRAGRGESPVPEARSDG